MVLVVRSIDAQGNVEVIRGWSACCPGSPKFSAGWNLQRGTAANGKIAMDYPSWQKDVTIRGEFALGQDGKLYGTDTYSTGLVTNIVMSEIR
jgi:hypothetical protein